MLEYLASNSSGTRRRGGSNVRHSTDDSLAAFRLERNTPSIEIQTADGGMTGDGVDLQSCCLDCRF